MKRKQLQRNVDRTQNSLLSVSFQGLLWTNFLTVVNDNAFRWLVIGIGKDFFPPEDQGWLLMIGSICFIAPYLVFASIAGWLADRFSKRDVIVVCKFLEIAIMGLGSLAIYLGNFNLLLVCTFLMGTQSALFAPAKVGTIPELLDETKIAAANGFFNLAALSATVIGMALGGLLKDTTGIKGQANLSTSALVLVGIAVVGTILSLGIRRMPIANPLARFPRTLIGETFRDLHKLWKNGPLFRVAIGISFFWAVGALAQLNIDQFAFESGALFERHRTPLLISLVLGVGIGSVMAGLLSAGRIELGLVPWGALGISTFAIGIFFTPTDFISYPVKVNAAYVCVCALLAFLGISAGLFDVPLASYLQNRSPLQTRGAILSAVNFMLFAGMMLTSFLFYGMRAPTYPANFADLPEQYQTYQLTPAEVSTLDREVDAFKQHLEDKQERQPEYVKGVVDQIPDPRLRTALLTQLLWVDMSTARERKIEFSRQAYYDEFSDDADKLVVKHVYEKSARQPLLTTRQVFLVLGLLTLPIFFYAALKLYLEMTRIVMYWVLCLVYRVKVTGYQNLPHGQGVVLVGNHSTWIDGAIYLILVPRRIRMIAWAGNFKSQLMQRIAKFCRIILITGGPKSIVRGLNEARLALGQQEAVGLFPEGTISKTGQILDFKPGVIKILDKMPVPIIPVYVDQFWGSIFTHAGGRTLRPFPRSLRHPLVFNIGQPITDKHALFAIRQAVMNLSADSVAHRISPFAAPISTFISRCKQRKFKLKIADSTNAQLTGGTLLMKCVILKRLLSRLVLDPAEKHVGVLIPPTAGAFVVNMALALDQRIAINLNYTVSSAIMNECIRQAGIKHVLTTRKVMEQFKFELECNVVYLEDFKDKVSLQDKVAGVVASYVTPGLLLNRWYGLHHIKPDDVLTIIFTSGSTGIPKGVMLTHQNIATNLDAMDQIVHLKKSDVVVGILPFFHSFGYMATMWGAASLNIAAAYHFSPLEANQIGKLAEKYKATLLLATPTFLRGFLRKCTKQQFANLDVVVTGAEQLPVELADAFENKFGVRPVEGYGATELSPLVSLNVPPSRSMEKFAMDCKEKTVGRPIPNVATKIIDVDTQAELGANQSGILWIKGPNVMKGYLNQPELTAQVIQNGWYNTGDMAMVDDQGFIHITGRISRFSKIGGEMIPHIRIEEVLCGLLTEDEQSETKLAVTAVADSRKGERIIVLHKPISKTPAELITGLNEAGLPNLYIPNENSFIQVEELPLLGTGKLDLKALKQLAETLAQEAT
ncbi:MAG TPA: MFS transporter [Pirellulaceae bacterium]|nr:MFS transporter [Pirellulaceae bacterium]